VACAAATDRACAVIRIRGLTKGFAQRRGWGETLRHPWQRRWTEALRGVTLDVPKGEFYGLLGPNGAGKTTLFKVLSTLLLPEEGTVEVAGVDAVRRPAEVRRLLTPVIADERSLNWRLTGRENLALYAALYGVSRPQRQAVVAGMLERVGLAAAGDRMAGTYSSGMKQRLLIGRALLSTPAVLLLDEPTRSLDPVSARDFRRFLREELVGRQGCTVVLATHDADEALGLCDHLAVLHQGRVVAEGTARQLAATAGENQYGLLVPVDNQGVATAALNALGFGEFVASRADAPEGWVRLVGELPGSESKRAEVMQALVGRGVPVAEMSRIPLPLADLIERLVQRVGAA